MFLSPPLLTQNYKNTSFLAQFDATVAVDSTGKTISAAGFVALDTGTKKYGAAAATGNADATLDEYYTGYYSSLRINLLNEFCLEGWFRHNRTGGVSAFPLFGIEAATGEGMQLEATNAGGPNFDLTVHITDDNSFSVADTILTIPQDTWHHFALTGDGVNLKVYLDGILSITRALPLGGLVYTPSASMRLKGHVGGPNHQGWHDSVRFSRVVVYTGNFTPVGPLTII